MSALSLRFGPSFALGNRDITSGGPHDVTAASMLLHDKGSARPGARESEDLSMALHIALSQRAHAFVAPAALRAFCAAAPRGTSINSFERPVLLGGLPINAALVEAWLDAQCNCARHLDDSKRLALASWVDFNTGCDDTLTPCVVLRGGGHMLVLACLRLSRANMLHVPSLPERRRL